MMLSALIPLLLQSALLITAIIALAILFVVVRFWLLDLKRLVPNCKLYAGRVNHCRLKGGAVHSFDYPIFFSYIDLKEIERIKGYLWPIFELNSSISFCSLENKEHLKEFTSESNSLFNKTKRFLQSNGLEPTENIRLLSHLTYFGYCFNPVSFFYILNADANEINSVIAEVSNTPWIEQHPYTLHETINNVTVTRKTEPEYSFEASWHKVFHVSPFMEMDYKYLFEFGLPTNSIWVRSRMMKLSTNEIWFSANFKLQAISFNPLNLLYVLIFYPLHTRMIQVWIHYEAVKLWLKGIPVFDHPNGTDVDFGYGITGSRLVNIFSYVLKPFNLLCGIFTQKHKAKTK
jgi:hypothetical protein